jgi:Transposase IS4
LNKAVDEWNDKERGAKVRHFSEREFLIGLGTTIGAAGFNCRGCELWTATSLENETLSDPRTWVTINENPDFGKFMGENRFKEYRKLVAKIWETKEAQDNDPWWEFSSAINEFNEQRKRLVRPSNWVVADESMSAWCPRKSKTGGLPNISYIIRKPEPLGTPFVVYLFFSFVLSHFLRNGV